MTNGTRNQPSTTAGDPPAAQPDHATAGLRAARAIPPASSSPQRPHIGARISGRNTGRGYKKLRYLRQSAGHPAMPSGMAVQSTNLTTSTMTNAITPTRPSVRSKTGDTESAAPDPCRSSAQRSIVRTAPMFKSQPQQRRINQPHHQRRHQSHVATSPNIRQLARYNPT